jgi:hypothetical protein
VAVFLGACGRGSGVSQSNKVMSTDAFCNLKIVDFEVKSKFYNTMAAHGRGSANDF